MWPPHLIQLLTTQFESSNSTYNNALSNISEKQLTFYRKALKDLSNTLAEAVSDLRKERVEEIKELVEHTQILTPNASDHSQGRKHPQPADRKGEMSTERILIIPRPQGGRTQHQHQHQHQHQQPKYTMYPTPLSCMHRIASKPSGTNNGTRAIKPKEPNQLGKAQNKQHVHSVE